LNRRNVFLFFVLPFLGVAAFFSVATFFQHRDLKARTEGLVRGQLAATARILGQAVSRSLDEGRAPQSALDTAPADDEIYFMALLDAQGEVLAWNSRFEGYLPFSRQRSGAAGSGIIDSPAGRILAERAAVTAADGRRFDLFLGYALTGMEDMIARSRRTSFLLLAVVLLVGALFFRGVYVLQSRFLAKSREAEAERREKEHFRDIAAFTSGVAHEIKNPLNSLALVFELLGRRIVPDAKGDLDLGKAQVRTIGRIVDRFSRVIKVVRPDLGAATLDGILHQAAERLGAEIPAAAGRVRVEAPPAIGLNADADLMVQAVLNILKNAVEASPAGPVLVAGRRAGSGAEIVVRDEGPGFTEEAAARLFDPFYTTKETGMGIGLYLAKRIVEAHGGTIGARGREGGGAEFRIILPGA